MLTLREHLRAIAYGEQMAHEDELIDLYQEHAVAALKILDAKLVRCPACGAGWGHGFVLLTCATCRAEHRIPS